jgi:hypothetical protein
MEVLGDVDSKGRLPHPTLLPRDCYSFHARRKVEEKINGVKQK